MLEGENNMLANYNVYVAEENKRLANSVKIIEIEINDLIEDLKEG